MRSAVKVTDFDLDGLWEHRASFRFLCKQKSWKYPSPIISFVIALIGTIHNDGDKLRDLSVKSTFFASFHWSENLVMPARECCWSDKLHLAHVDRPQHLRAVT